MEIKKVGVVGCGTMGAGIVQVCAQSGYPVVVSEINEKLLKKGLSLIERSLNAAVDKGKLTQGDRKAILSRIRGTTNTADFGDCDLVIEAAIENMNLKKQIFANLDKVCPKQAILASNTSCLSVIEMATATSRPDKVVGMHFFNPVPVMKLLELVRTIATSDETVAAVQKVGESVGKTVVITTDTPGFIANRLLFASLLEAVRILESNVATKEDIDTAMKLGLNHPIGPLALADLIGIDTCMFIASAMYEELKDPKFAPPTLMKRMVAAGWLGRKTGKGFYEYK